MANPFDEFDNVNPFDEFDDVPKKKKAGMGTAIASSFANVGNMADTAISTLAGSAAALFGQEKDALTIREEMEARNQARNEWANPDKEEIGFGGKLAGGLATLPMQVVGMGFSPATTVKTMKDAGENNIKSTWAGIFDAAGNALSIAAPMSLASGPLGRAVTGGLFGAAQDAGTKALIQATADTEKGRAAFQPTLEDSAVAGIIGMGAGVALGPKGEKKPPQNTADKIRAAAAARAAEEAARQPDVVPTIEDVRDTRNGAQLSGEAYAAALRERELQRTSAFNRPDQFPDMVQESPMDRMVRDLGGEPNVPATPDSVMGRMAEDLTTERSTPDQRAAQDLIEQRQAQLEQDMRIRATPELQAAERARQEQAPAVSPEHQKLIDDMEAMQQAQREQEAIRLEQARQAEEAQRQAEAQQAIEARNAALEADVATARAKDEAISDVAHRRMGPEDTTRSGSILDNFKNKAISNRGAINRQRGAIDTKAISDTYDAVKRGVATRMDYFRAWKGAFDARAMSAIEDDLRDPKSRSTLVLMRPDSFHNLALKRDDMVDAPRLHSNIEQGLESEKGLREIPQLWTDTGPDGVAQVTGHEGRHRMDVFKKMGIEAVPVIIRDSGYRWGGTDPYAGPRPTKIRPEGGLGKGAKVLDFPAKTYHDYIQEAPAAVDRTTKPIGQRGFANSQTGATTFFNFGKKDPDRIKVENSLVASEDGTYIPNNPDTKVAIEKALEQGKDGKQWTYVQSGSTSVAMKLGSPIIKAASETIQNALKRADLLIRNSIFPAEQRIKNLSRDDITTLAEVFKDEMKLGKRYDGDILANNFSVKQIEAYTEMRKMFDDALDAQNAARLAKGQDPIAPMEAYMASRWQGDFRRPIYEYVKNKDGSFKLNKDGSKAQKLVWYLADNTRGGLEKQSKALLKDFPDLIIDPKKDHTVRSSTSKTELDSMYTRMLDILGRDDPAIQKIQQAIADQEMVRGAGALGQEKHFEKKAGIRGFVGDRPGTNPRQEAIAMFQQQIQYAKNAYRWSELQKAADDIKAITSDPRLQEQQPNNIKYIREYFKNAVGMGESRMARAFDDTLRDGLGVSPTIINNAVGDIKSFFILQKLAASAGYTLANMVQTSNVIPYLAQMAGAGYRGNPATATLAGTLQGMAMGAWHYARALDPNAQMPLPNQFMKDAFAYAEDNGVIARSVYDESPIQASFGVVGGAANLAAKTMTIPESFVRSVAFMTYANMLKSSGKFTDNSKLFQMAEEYVNKSMVDYRETERPLMFAKAGAAGNFANTLQTYPISFYNQYAYMVKQAMEGNPWGLGAMLAVHYGVAGLMGIPGFDDADKVYKWLRDNALPTDMWADVMQSPFMSDPKLWLIENAGKSAVYGALSENTGLGLTSRVAAPGAGAMLQSPVGPIADIGKQAINLGKAVVDPTDKAKWAQVGMGSLPVGMQGLLETSDFMKDYTFVKRPDGKQVFMKTTDIADRKGGYARTPEEIQMRKFGLRSQKEVVERDVSYATTSALQTQAKKSGELIDRFYSAVRQGNKAEAQKLNRLYIQLTGKEDGIRDMDIENQIKEEFMTDVERSNSAINTVNKAKAMARMNAILEKR